MCSHVAHICYYATLPLQTAQRRVMHASSLEQLEKLRDDHRAAVVQGERDGKALQALGEVRGIRDRDRDRLPDGLAV